MGWSRKAAETLVWGQLGLGRNPVGAASASNIELTEIRDDTEDLALLHRRLKDTDVSENIAHEEIAAEINNGATYRGLPSRVVS